MKVPGQKDKRLGKKPEFKKMGLPIALGMP